MWLRALCLACLAMVALGAMGDELPHLRGEKYITTITMDSLEQHTKNRPEGSPTLLYIGAKWCPHCRNFKPVFHTIADSIEHEKQTGLRPQCLYYEAVEDKDPISKKFKLGGYPAVLLFKRNKFYKYEGGKEAQPILDWIDSHSEILGETYPDYVPGLLDELQDAVIEIWKNLRASYKRDPTTGLYLVGAVAVVLGAFLVCFLYALLASCCGQAEEESKEKEE